MSPEPLRVAGIVLCGGQSRRMGRAKAWLPFGGRPMLVHVVEVLRQAVQPVVVVAAPGQEVPPLPGDVLLVCDAETGRGPMQGLAAGLHALDGVADAAYVSGCDVPLLRAEFVRRMVELLGAHSICVPVVGGRQHPLAGVYRVELGRVVERMLKEDRLRMMDLFGEVATRFVGEAELGDVDPELESLRNLNTPEEYRAEGDEVPS